MATMIPNNIVNIEKCSPGEIDLFEKLKNDNNITRDWYVLHSLRNASEPKKFDGEMDFLVIIPDKGIICIEVKASRVISRIGGTWDFGSYYKSEPPFEQVKKSMWHVEQRLKKEFVYRRPRIFPCVIFTLADLKDEYTYKGDEWYDWQIITRNQYEGTDIGTLLTDFIDQSFTVYSNENKGLRYNGPPNKFKSIQIVDFLRQDLIYTEPALSTLNRAARKISQLDDEQKHVLTLVKQHGQRLFEGPAGTGKTILALEDALVSSNAGQSVLLICYNSNLATWMKDNIPENDNLKISNIDQLLLDITDATPPEPSASQAQVDAFFKILPRIAEKRLLDESLSREIWTKDKIVVDEAQDIVNDKYLPVLNQLVKKGLEEGDWTMFGDFDNQAIYNLYPENKPSYSVDLLQTTGAKLSPFQLKRNYRNTDKIIEYVDALTPKTERYTEIMRTHNLSSPQVKYYGTIEEQEKELRTILNNLSDEEIPDSRIIILSAYANRRSCGARISDLIPYGDSREGVHYCSVQSYKGLEAPIVILTDVEEVQDAYWQSVLYVGLTRAQEQLYLLANRNNQKAMDESIVKIISNGGIRGK